MTLHSFSARTTATLALFCLALSALAQSADPSQDILPPSPTAAAFTKNVDFPVNTSTGTPSISVPLGVVSANKISVPISLDYHAGGVKVDEVSGMVGLGWMLNAGGVINRTVRDRRDEDLSGGYLQHAAEIPTPQINSQAEFDAMNSIALGDWDGQPDLFQFSFGGYSGKFVFSSATTVQLIPKQDLKITYTTCSGAGCPTYLDHNGIISFTITTPDGVQYMFGTIDAVEASQTNHTTLSGVGCGPKEYPSPSITAWHLKTITNPRSGDVITFTYNSYTSTYHLSYNESYKFKYTGNNTTYCQNIPPSTNPKCITTKTDYGKILASITSPLGRIDFTPDAVRSDMNMVSGNCRIKEAKIYGKNNILLKSFQFDQTFVQSTGATPSTAPATKYRMYLDGVREFSSSSVQVNSWLFEYHNRTLLPPRLSFAQDHWGYFNNKSNQQLTPSPVYTSNQSEIVTLLDNGFVPANREPDPLYSYYGNMKRVTYPTGGTTDYEYEGNELPVCNTVNVATPANVSLSLTYTGAVQTQTVNFTVDGQQPVKITYDVQQNGLHFEGAYVRLKRISPTSATLNTWGAQMSSPALNTTTSRAARR